MNWLRIIDVLEQKFPSGALPKVLDVRSQYISDIKSGKSKNPGADFLLKLIDRLGINPAWFEDMSQPVFYQDVIRDKSTNEKIPLVTEFEKAIDIRIYKQTASRLDEIELRLAALEQVITKNSAGARSEESQEDCAGNNTDSSISDPEVP